MIIGYCAAHPWIKMCGSDFSHSNRAVFVNIRVTGDGRNHERCCGHVCMKDRLMPHHIVYYLHGKGRYRYSVRSADISDRSATLLPFLTHRVPTELLIIPGPQHIVSLMVQHDYLHFKRVKPFHSRLQLLKVIVLTAPSCGTRWLLLCVGKKSVLQSPSPGDDALHVRWGKVIMLKDWRFVGNVFTYIAKSDNYKCDIYS